MNSLYDVLKAVLESISRSRGQPETLQCGHDQLADGTGADSPEHGSESLKSDGRTASEHLLVRPVPGSVVYCDLAFGFAEHSGIYIGGNQIVALEHDGRIVPRSPDGFMEGTPATRIYVSCRRGRAVGSEEAAERARQMIGSRRDYSFISDNCHQFCAGCLLGNFENSVNFLSMLQMECRMVLGADSWGVRDLGHR